MTSQVPLLRPREVLRAFEKLGWAVARQRGSHTILTKEGHTAALSVPDHPQVARGTPRALLSRAGVTLDEFLQAAKG